MLDGRRILLGITELREGDLLESIGSYLTFYIIYLPCKICQEHVLYQNLCCLSLKPRPVLVFPDLRLTRDGPVNRRTRQPDRYVGREYWQIGKGHDLNPPRVLNSVTSSHLPRPCPGLFSLQECTMFSRSL